MPKVGWEGKPQCCHCGVMASSPVGMVVPGDGRALTWHITAYTQSVFRLSGHGLTPFLQCPIQNQGDFCGAGLHFMRIVSCRNLENKNFSSEHSSVCAHAQ